MNHHVLTELARARRQSVRDDFARGSIVMPEMRPLLARVLRASGDRLFRLGVDLDDRVSCASGVETPFV